jgi:hypothetical protein
MSLSLEQVSLEFALSFCTASQEKGWNPQIQAKFPRSSQAHARQDLLTPGFVGGVGKSCITGEFKHILEST